MVTLITSTPDLEAERSKEQGPVAFVPTMGNLHHGHVSLLERALEEFTTVYFSIFVNPKQFGPHEDFNRYPRTLQDDLQLIGRCLEKHPGKRVIVYAPSKPSEVFPEGYDTAVTVPGLSHELEGALRPGHFDGVATVVHRLFCLVRPRKAYFGLKDYQQFLVIRQMTGDLSLEVEVVGMPIIRDHDGLALSSRNQYLSESERKDALILSRSLREVAAILGGKRQNIAKARETIRALTADPGWNYLELRDASTLSADLDRSRELVLLGVYQLGTTRLLDNLTLEIT